VKARVAVLSLWFAEAAEEGWRVPPAPETGTGVSGLEVSVARMISPALPETAGADSEVAEEAATTALVEDAAPVDAARVTKTVVTELHCATAGAAEVAATKATTEEIDVAPGAVVVAATDAAPPPPNVKAWLASPGLQLASSRMLAEETVKHVPTAFSG
jgi:hypothetical protein